MREGYNFGGEYYCHQCKHSHHTMSDIGKLHIKYARTEVQRHAFLTFGVYKK